MKLIRVFLVAQFVFYLVGCKTTQSIAPPIVEVSNFAKLASINNIVSLEKREPISHFDENYEIWFEQPIDHNDPSKGTFRQRVFLGFENDTLPVIVELRGYGIGPERAGELADH